MALNFMVEEYAGRSYFRVRDGFAETYEQAQEIARHYRGARILVRTKTGTWRKAKATDYLAAPGLSLRPA